MTYSKVGTLDKCVVAGSYLLWSTQYFYLVSFLIYLDDHTHYEVFQEMLVGFLAYISDMVLLERQGGIQLKNSVVQADSCNALKYVLFRFSVLSLHCNCSVS